MALLRIREIRVRQAIVRSGLPGSDFVINPYVGCMHGCKYCYARFMKRFTGHTEPWGQFVDVKINAPDLIPADRRKYKGRELLMSSVTDPYQPVERKYQITRRILERLVRLQPSLCVLTKSSLVTRDTDLFKQFKDCIVAVSLSFLDDRVRRELEPLTSPVSERIRALQELHQAGLRTALFISPIFPGISDWRGLIDRTKDFVDEYWFENLNLYPSIQDNVYSFLKSNRPGLVKEYQKIYSPGSSYWCEEEKRIKEYCQEKKVLARVYFHHGRKQAKPSS